MVHGGILVVRIAGVVGRVVEIRHCRDVVAPLEVFQY